MKYIVNRIADMIINNAPAKDSEMMIRIDGFQDLRIYESVAQLITKYFSKSGLTVDVKIAAQKFAELEKLCNDTSVIQTMKSNQWIAENQSITYYRNLHNVNVRVLLGTENEQDSDGLLNCFAVTPDTLVNDLNKHYSNLFADMLNILSDLDCTCVNKLYGDLFTYVPFDIVKLSDLADSYENSYSNLNDFIAVFYRDLPKWGLPARFTGLPNINKILGSGTKKRRRNILADEYGFISRTDFKKMSATRFKKYRQQFDRYDAEGQKYSSTWSEWSVQPIPSYEQFKNVTMQFIQGSNIVGNRNKLLQMDYDIIESVLGYKVTIGPTPKKKPTKVYGDPLYAFTDAVMRALAFAWEQRNNVAIDKIELAFNRAEIVVNTNTVEEDSDTDLLNAWKKVCVYANGAVDYLKEKTGFEIDGRSIDITLNDNDFFLPTNAVTAITKGIITAASSDKTYNNVYFSLNYYTDDVLVFESAYSEYQWTFSDDSPWLYSFSKLLENSNSKFNYGDPIEIIKNIKPLIFAKSEEEFFDLLMEIDNDQVFDLEDFITKTKNPIDIKFKNQFAILGTAFKDFVKEIRDVGFYGSLNKGALSKVWEFIKRYTDFGTLLLNSDIPQNDQWVLDCYLLSYSMLDDEEIIKHGEKLEYCILPAWHPATLQKICNQKTFFLDGLHQWWQQHIGEDDLSLTQLYKYIDELVQMCAIPSVVDVFPLGSNQYFGIRNTFGNFSVYADPSLVNDGRIKDAINKDAIFDDDFDRRDLTEMNENARMLYDGLRDYIKAFPNSLSDLKLVYLNPSDLQPVVASVYALVKKYQERDIKINISLKILVKPENRGGKNYLAYWMDEFFSEDENVNIKAYLNVWNTKSDLENLLNGNDDIIFALDFLTQEGMSFTRANDPDYGKVALNECYYPIVYKPGLVSSTATSSRRIEVTQPQFSVQTIHTQIARYRNNIGEIPREKWIAVNEVKATNDSKAIIKLLHENAYWVICIGNSLDGALLKEIDDYSVIGFSTGKGAFGQYNVTITTRQEILDILEKQFARRMMMLFHWDSAKIDQASHNVISAASRLDGISLFAAINTKDHAINEFMAYVLTALRESEHKAVYGIRTIIHLDSYTHWFSGFAKDDSESRPDYLILETLPSQDDSVLKLHATVVECKIATALNKQEHIDKALTQVEHGLKLFKRIFNPNSTSIMRRYWNSQLYRALAFAQVSFKDTETEFAELSEKIRRVLDGQYEIEWDGKVLGYWFDQMGSDEIVDGPYADNTVVINIPQIRIQRLLLKDDISDLVFSQSAVDEIEKEDNIEILIEEREKQLAAEMKRKIVSKHDYSYEKESSEKESKHETITNEHTNEKQNEEPDAKIDVKQRDKKTPDLTDIRVLIGKSKLKNEDVYWEFGNPKMANRHLLITGTSGQGKTYSIQTMLYELSKSNISAVVFDYTEGFRLDQLEPIFVEKMGKRIQQRVIATQHVPLNPFMRQNVDFAGEIGKESITAVATRIADIFTHVYDFGEQQYSAIYQATRNGLQKYGDNMDFNHFYDELKSLQKEVTQAKSVFNKMTPFLDSVQFLSNETLNWGDILYSEESKLFIFQLTHYTRDMQVIITELLLWDAWYYTTKLGNKDKPFVVVLDEAQNLSHKENSPSGKILTEGRKFGWSAWYATQSLQVLASDEVTRLSQAAFKLHFKPTSDEVKKMSQTLDPSDPNKWINQINSLNKGQCIVVGDRVRNGGVFGNTQPTVTSVEAFEERD